MANRKLRRQTLAKLRATRSKFDDRTQRIVDQLLAQKGEAWPTERIAGNGMTVAIRNDKLVARVTCHLQGRPQIWIDYNLEQLTKLITYLSTVRDQLVSAPPEELN